MAEDREAKKAIRELWVEQATFFQERYPENDVPLYLTLSGIEAHDIKLLIKNKIINLTENGSIAEDSIDRVVAIEQDQSAVLTLQRALPGLKILKQPIANLLAGESLINFPTNKEHIKYFCARIINFDLNCSLDVKKENNTLRVPVISWIEKLSILRAEKKPNIDWCLLLTLNASIRESEDMDIFIKNFLCDNYRQSNDFKSSCDLFFGEDLQSRVTGENNIKFSSLESDEQKKILMIVVPKKIAQLVHQRNWQVTTLWNLSYGGNGSQAPMVTWVLRFSWDERASSTPNVVYIDSIKTILSSIGSVQDDGRIQVSSHIYPLQA